MITALVQFPLPASVSRDKAAELFKGSAPKYRDLPETASGSTIFYSAETKTGGGLFLLEVARGRRTQLSRRVEPDDL